MLVGDHVREGAHAPLVKVAGLLKANLAPRAQSHFSEGHCVIDLACDTWHVSSSQVAGLPR